MKTQFMPHWRKGCFTAKHPNNCPNHEILFQTE
jgi:hypothetical protein